MSYVKHTWVDNETITASKLNNIEDGIDEAAQSGGGYDAEISIYHDNNSGHDPVITIISGTFSELSALLQNNIAPFVLVRIFDEMNYVYTSTTAVPIYLFNSDYIEFAINITSVYDGGGVYKYFGIDWLNTDEIVVV